MAVSLDREALSPTLPASEDRLSVGTVLTAARKSWIAVVASVAIVGIAATFFTMGQTKLYQANATILFDPQPPRPLGKDVQAVVDLAGDYMNKKEYYRTQFWVLQSQRMATLVVQRLALQRDAGFLGNLPAGAKPAPGNVAVEDAARILRSRISVDSVKDSRLAVITYEDADPARAQRILGVLVDTYVHSNLEDALEAMNVAADWLGNQVESLKKDLESNEMSLHEYKKHKDILSVSMDDQSNMLRGEMLQLNQALTTTRAERERVAARRTELSKINPEDPADIPATELMASTLLQKLRNDYVDAVEARNALTAVGKAENHPEVLALQSRINGSRSTLLAEIQNIQTGVEHDYNVVTTASNGLSALLQSAKKRALELNLLEIEYNRLQRTKDNSEKLYGLVTERSKENDLTRLLRFNNIRIVDRPLLPRAPVTPNLPLNVGAGLLMGLVLGLIGVVMKEQLDRSIKTPDDAERTMGASFLGLVPLLAESGSPAPYNSRKRARRDAQSDPHSRPELVVHYHPTSGIAEAARAVRTNILFMSPDRPYKTLLITSAAPFEGKTTVACCIAVAMAQAGKRVALLDCDMRRPRIHRVFGSSNDRGITTALLDLSTLDEVTIKTEVPNLSVISTGPLPPNPAEILHSEAFERLLSSIQDRFDTVVIDSPPVAPVTDATILSTRVDGTVLVARARHTRKDVARRAARSIRDVGGKIVGTVLNAVDFNKRADGYSQYYYYRQTGYGPETGTKTSDDHAKAGGNGASPPSLS